MASPTPVSLTLFRCFLPVLCCCNCSLEFKLTSQNQAFSVQIKNQNLNTLKFKTCYF